MRLLYQSSLCLLFLGLWVSAVHSAEPIRIGVLKFGTVNWELEVIRQNGLDRANGVAMVVVPLAGKNATHVALQGGAVDMIVSDLIWASRQRQAGNDYTFAPYSNAAGAVMVRPDSGITDPLQLQGHRLGVAGGPLDKSWLLLSAWMQARHGKSLKTMVEPNFAAPPLLNELMLRGELPASLNFWHYSARLEAAGMTPLIRVRDLLPELGIQREIPLIGWVFSERWAADNAGVVSGFMAASREAKELMATDDGIWKSLRPMLKVDSDATADTLKDAFRSGSIECFDRASADAVARAFAIVGEIGGAALTGESQTLAEGTIWPGAIGADCP